MSNVLAIETSTAQGSVALRVDGSLIAEETFMAERGHTGLLFPVLERFRKQVEKFDRSVVGTGPGSYAGIRIGIAAATGLAAAHGSEICGIPSVAAFEIGSAEYLAIGDARREMFYFAKVKAGVCEEGPQLLSQDDLEMKLTNTPNRPVLTSDPRMNRSGTVVSYPSARRLVEISGNYRVSRIGEIEPLYLREAHITRPAQK